MNTLTPLLADVSPLMKAKKAKQAEREAAWHGTQRNRNPPEKQKN
jgi:hypothetical protein